MKSHVNDIQRANNSKERMIIRYLASEFLDKTSTLKKKIPWQNFYSLKRKIIMYHKWNKKFVESR